MSPAFRVEAHLPYFRVLWFVAVSFAIVEGAVQIKQCSRHGWLEILETGVSAPYVTCQGLDAALGASWRLLTDDGEDQGRSLCGPFGQECNSTSGNLRVYRPGGGFTHLYIISEVREMAGNGTVTCSVVDVNESASAPKSTPASADVSSSSASCRINVVAPATLTSCEVTMTKDRILSGACRFLLAFSSNDSYSCTWTQTWTNGQHSISTTIAGVIHKAPEAVSGKLFYSGTCSFTSPWLQDGQYSYTVHFFPGPDTMEEGSRILIGSPYVTPEVSTSTAATPTTNQNASPGSKESSSLTVYVIVGVTAGVVIIVTIIIGIVCVMRFKAKTLRHKARQHRRETPANHFTPFHEDKTVWYNDRNRQNSLHVKHYSVKTIPRPSLDADLLQRERTSTASIYRTRWS